MMNTGRKMNREILVSENKGSREMKITWMVLYRNLAGVEKTGAFRDTGTDCRTSFDRTFDRRAHTGIFVSVPGRRYLVCRLYDQ